MSTRISLSQKSRPYKIEVYGLQDNYIGTLQSYNDSFIGQIIEPEIVISDDGTQTFVCSIPKFYIDPETNLKLENPRWADVNNGVLAENTRILKVFLKNGEEDKIYPFIVDKITDKRDSHFAIYKEVECNGLAYAELGKTGYKLELTKEIVELELKKNPDLLPTMDYWLDKVFPNEKDADGKIIKWLTPWCYEIRMDWSHYSAGINRESNKMYEDSYVNSWMVETIEDENKNVISEKLASNGFTQGKEKARFIDCTKGNRYNITQSIAEAFEVFCQYEYKCDIHGHFVKEYFEEIKDENDEVLYKKVWTGRKVIFYNRAIKTENPVFIEYKKNLDTISRTKESSELYTKLYVTPIESSTMDSGYISIADTTLNPTLDDFILNFDYLYSTGTISQYQMNFVKTYEIETHKVNKQLIDLAPHIEDLTIQINDLEAKKKIVENEISSAETNLNEYQTLAESEVRNIPIQKNKNNSFSMIFYADGNILKGRFALEGVEKTSIVAYKDIEYNNKIFSGEELITIQDWITPSNGDTNFYLLLDEFGWPEYIYTAKDRGASDDGFKPSIVYFELTYCPKNEYEDICKQLQERIDSKEIAFKDLEKKIEELKNNLTKKEEEQDRLLKDKDILNYKLETVLGPALREGYWTPEAYEDPGESVIVSGIKIGEESQDTSLFFDTDLFDEENLNYYYASVDDASNNKKTYYDYLKISKEILDDWKQGDLSTLVLKLSDPYDEWTHSTSKLPAGDYYLIYNGQKYYFKFDIDNIEKLKLTIENKNPIIEAKNDDGTKVFSSSSKIEEAVNITSYFKTTLYLGERFLYCGAGFDFGFIDGSPIILLNNKDIDYHKYQNISYVINTADGKIEDNFNGEIQVGSEEDKFGYPRILINRSNVNYKSDLLQIIPYDGEFDAEESLINYEDYSILVRNGRPYFTLKLTDRNNFNTLYNYKYRIEYRVSRANEMLYLDAKNVARDNSQPKYSYELKVSNIPEEINSYELGQLVYINDYSVGIHAASGYVSEIKLKLNSPKDDELKIKNYKTKFEDLFSTITASSEAMRNNQHSYNIAAGSFNADGTISGSVLQNSILNNNISMNYSNTNVEIDDINGIVLTNSQPYLNGVYGQVKLIGGGIFLSNAIDAAGARIWNTGITPNGINAALISAGQLDVEKVRVFAGDNIAFQWNGEGIFAYKRDENGNPDLNTYVHYSDKGLQFVSGNQTAVDLGWNGLLISTQDGSTELSGDLGLTVYYGQKNNDGSNYAIRVGKFIEDNQYGIRLYKEISNQDDETYSYVPTLITTNNGELWLKDTLTVGELAPVSWIDENGQPQSGNCIAGISGIKETYIGEDGQEYVANDSVRFWAGRDASMMNTAPFRVLQDGTLFATKAFIRGDIYAESGFFNGTIEAISGKIGGWTISKDVNEETNEVINYLMSEDGQTKLFGDGDIRIQIGENFSVDTDGVIKASAGQIGQLTIGDIDAMGGDITVNTAVLSVEGLTVVKIGENVNADFLVQCYRGNIPFKDMEYRQHYQNIIWEYAFDDTDEWFEIGREGINTSPIRTFNYSEVLQSSILIRCIFEGEEETIISNEILLTAITESDANAVIFSIVTPEGNIVNDVSKEVVLKAVLVDNGTTITNNITYLWEKYDIETKKYITLTEETNDTLTVKASDIISYGSYRCQAEYNNGTYLAYGSVQDGTDPLQCLLYSTIGNQILNGQGVGAIYARSYRGNVEVDPIKTTSFVTQLPSNFNEKNIYLLDNVNKQYVLYENNGSSWYPIEDNSVIIYTYSFRDKYGNNATYKGMTTYTGRVLYIDSELIDEKIIIDVTAEEAAI